MFSSSNAIITAGLGLVAIGIGLLVAAATRGALLLRKVFHPNAARPIPDSSLKVLRALGVLALAIGLLAAFIPVASAALGGGGEKPTSMTTAPSGTPSITWDGEPPTPTPSPTTTSTTPTSSTTSTTPTSTPTEPTTEEPAERFLSDIPVGNSSGLNQNAALTLNGTFYLHSIEVGCIFGMGKTLAPFAVGGYTTFDATLGVNDADPSPEVQQGIPCTVTILAGSKVLWQDTIKPTDVKHISFPLKGAARINIECDLNGPAKGYNVGRYPLGFGSAKIVR